MSCLVLLLSILIGLIPEALFFCLFVKGAKDIRRKFFTFCVLNIGAFVLLGIFFSYSIWLYVILTMVMYVIMKVLYQDTEFIDLFLLTVPYLILALVGYFCYGITESLPPSWYPNTVGLVLNRIFIFIILSALYPHLNKWYNSYKKLWNVHEDNRIKSITVRNISIVIFNILILVAYLMLLIRK